MSKKQPDKEAQVIGAGIGGLIGGVAGALIGGLVGAGVGAALVSWVGHEVARDAQRRGL